jgi:bla regulator protein blaR1
MTPAISNAILAISDSLAASIVVKATIVISIALITARMAHRSRASIRHAILAAGFAVLLALPLAAILAPPLHIALPVAQSSSTLPTNSVQSFDETSLAPAATNAPSSAAKSEAMSFSLFDFVFAAWVIGAAVFLAPIIIGLWQVRSLRRTALPWSQGVSVSTTLANELKLRRGVEVLLHESVAGPMTCGIFRPAIVFPVAAENWDEADLNRAVAHELEHVRRADWLTHCLARIVCAAYWFHPLVWIAWRQLTLEAERACDDAVLARSEATAYAEQLVALARQLTATNKSPLLAMASRSDLAQRVSAVLDNRQPHGPSGIFVPALAFVAAALVIITFSPIQLVAAQPVSQGQLASGAPLPSFDAASIKPVNSTVARAGAGAQFLPARIRASAPLRVLMQIAYGVQPFQIEGGPEWVGSDQYHIDATAAGNSSPGQERLMLRSLLADRFQLRFHRETRETSVLALVPARGGLKLAPPQDGNCVETMDVAGPLANPGARIQPPGQDARPVATCGGLTVALAAGGAEVLGGKVRMANFAQVLSRFFGRGVIDQTGFSGAFDVNLKFLPDETTPGLPPPPPGAVPVDTASPSIFTALQQLGLKLKSTKGPVEVLVIDHVERPTPN